MKKDELEVMFADESWDGLAEAIRENDKNGPVMSWPMHIKLKLLGLLHPIGLHYLVPAYQRDPASNRWIEIGTTCWFCP